MGEQRNRALQTQTHSEPCKLRHTQGLANSHTQKDPDREPDTDADGEIDRASELGLTADKSLVTFPK